MSRTKPPTSSVISQRHRSFLMAARAYRRSPFLPISPKIAAPMFDAMPLSPSSRRRLPRSLALSGLALAAVSSAAFVGLPAAAHAASPAVAAPVNGPIAYSVSSAVQQARWHDVNPDGSHDSVVPFADPGAYDGQGPGSGGTADAALNVVFSPDGSRALLQSLNGCEYLADADGTDPLAITAVPAPYTPCTSLGLMTKVVSTVRTPIDATKGLAWSADGKYVYFLDAAGAVNTLSADGATETKLPLSVPTGYHLLSAAPDGSLAFTDQTLSHISVLDPKTGTLHVLTTGQDAHYSAATGKLLVTDFAASANGAGMATLFLVDPANGNRTQVTDPTAETVQSFTWSPDGTQVAYFASAPNGQDTGGVYSRSVSGGPRRTVVQTPGVLSVTGWHNGPIAPARAADRIGGADRIATAVDASQWSYAGHGAGGRQASVAVISRSDQFADALGGSALAAEKGGPLLLTPTSGLDPRVRDELKRVLAPGSVVYVLGGDAALSPAVEQQIKALGFSTRRLAGADRFGTSVLTAQQVSAHPHTVMVATGVQFPDALTAGAAAAQDPNGGVVVLSDDKALTAPVKAYLAGVNPADSSVYGVGGQGVAALRGAFPQWAGKITPLSGADRFATAAAVASSPLFTANGPVGRVGVATGLSWPDALSGGALIATQHGPLLLTDPNSQFLPAAELNVAKTLAPHLSGVVVFGGLQAVGSVATNTEVALLGHLHYFTYQNRQSPDLAGPR